MTLYGDSMKLKSPWVPRLSNDGGVTSNRLMSALSEDIRSGVISAGDRLPPHRELAWLLKIGVATVTKAYIALERQGLLRTVHGRGTFVAESVLAAPMLVDLSVNAPPQMLSDRLVSATLAALTRRLDAVSFSAYTPSSGRSEHRRLLVRWLETVGVPAREEGVYITNGAQQALMIAMSVACSPGSVMFTEAQTYPGALLLTRQSGYNAIGLGMDEEGLRPDLLDRALAEHGTIQKVVYVTPTLQNPTTATMGLERREAIARICRKHDAILIEDDVYGIFAPHGLPCLTALIPERSFYVGGFSKTLSPGLRVGILTAPRWAQEEAGLRAQMSHTMTSPLSSQILEMWLTDGTAEELAASIRNDAARRSALAKQVLEPVTSVASASGFHVWLPMPTVRAEEFVFRAARRGIILMPAKACLTDQASPDGGVRISLGGPEFSVLERALMDLKNGVGA